MDIILVKCPRCGSDQCAPTFATPEYGCIPCGHEFNTPETMALIGGLEIKAFALFRAWADMLPTEEEARAHWDNELSMADHAEWRRRVLAYDELIGSQICDTCGALGDPRADACANCG